MYHFISSRAPHLVSKTRTLHPTPNGISKPLRRVDAPVSTRACPDVHRQFLGHAAFFSSRQTMESLGDSKQLEQPTLLRPTAWALTGIQALIPTATRAADGSVAMRWSGNRALHISTLMLYAAGL
jgi:hypothetical protein